MKTNIAGPEGIPPLRFNLSHTRGLAAIAVTLEDEVGVDVERIVAPADMTLAETCFADDEIAWLQSTPAAEQANRFFEIWTLKEAYLKAKGTGLSLPLKDFSVGIRDECDPKVISISFRGSIVDNTAAWQFHRCRLSPQHALAVALNRPASQPMQVTFRPWR